MDANRQKMLLWIQMQIQVSYRLTVSEYGDVDWYMSPLSQAGFTFLFFPKREECLRTSPKKGVNQILYGVIPFEYFVNPSSTQCTVVPHRTLATSGCQVQTCTNQQPCGPKRFAGNYIKRRHHERWHFDSSSLRPNVAEQLRQTWILVVSHCGSKVFWIFPMLFNQWWRCTDQMTPEQIMTHFILNARQTQQYIIH